MFSGLRPQATIYVLHKDGKPRLQLAQVVSVSNPTPKYSTIPSYPQEMVVDVIARADGEQLEFKQLPTTQSIANSGNVVVSDSRDAMLQEVEGMRRLSQDALDNVEHHKDVITACEAISASLNPSIAQDQRIGAMEKRMGGMEDTLSNIQSMLASALEKSSKK